MISWLIVVIATVTIAASDEVAAFAVVADTVFLSLAEIFLLLV